LSDEFCNTIPSPHEKRPFGLSIDRKNPTQHFKLYNQKCTTYFPFTWSENKVRELIAVKVLHTSLLNTTVVAFKVLPLGSYAPMLAPSPPFKKILELVLWNDLQSCRCITLDVINVIKMPSFQNFPLSSGTGKSHWRLDPVNRQGVPTQLLV